LSDHDLGRVLIVAGSDSGGGAGIQADIKTVTALGGYAATAITALTAQDTHTVHGVSEVSADFVAQQMEVVLADIGADCIKTGMLNTADIVRRVANVLAASARGVPVVIDPVIVAKGGARLLQPGTVEMVRDVLLPKATVLTPNAPEAEALTGQPITSEQDMEVAATALLAMGPKAVLVKGGHLDTDPVVDLLATADGMTRFTSPRIDSTDTHGTGCTLASAIAVGIAQGMDLKSTVKRARDYVHKAIETAPGFGSGHGPLNHTHTFEKKAT
jgi:hydroxymethylpyrimidine/phosphomethylpyrimidine kinase